MKKYIRILGLACMAGALAFMSSCKKNETNTSMRVTIPAFEEETDGQRAYIDLQVNKLRWQADDAIMVFNVNSTDPGQSMMAYYTTGPEAEGQFSATFTTAAPTLGNIQDCGYYVYYPGSRRNPGIYSDPVLGDITEDGNRMSFTVEPKQTYFVAPDGNASLDPDALAMAWNGTDLDQVKLKHIFGVVKLGLYGNTKTVDHIELIDPDHAMCGKVSINMPAMNNQNMDNLKSTLKNFRDNGNDEVAAAALNTIYTELGYMPEESLGNMLTLDCSDYAITLAGTNYETFFYFSVRPGAFRDGFAFKVYYKDGTYQEVNDYLLPHVDGQPASYLVTPGGLKTYHDVNMFGREYYTWTVE